MAAAAAAAAAAEAFLVLCRLVEPAPSAFFLDLFEGDGLAVAGAGAGAGAGVGAGWTAGVVEGRTGAAVFTFTVGATGALTLAPLLPLPRGITVTLAVALGIATTTPGAPLADTVAPPTARGAPGCTAPGCMLWLIWASLREVCTLPPLGLMIILLEAGMPTPAPPIGTEYPAALLPGTLPAGTPCPASIAWLATPPGAIPWLELGTLIFIKPKLYPWPNPETFGSTLRPVLERGGTSLLGTTTLSLWASIATTSRGVKALVTPACMAA